MILRNIGKYYKNIGKYKNAEEYYLKSFELQKECTMYHLAGVTLLALSEICSLQGDWERASIYAKEAAEYLNTTKTENYQTCGFD